MFLLVFRYFWSVCLSLFCLSVCVLVCWRPIIHILDHVTQLDDTIQKFFHDMCLSRLLWWHKCKRDGKIYWKSNPGQFQTLYWGGVGGYILTLCRRGFYTTRTVTLFPYDDKNCLSQFISSMKFYILLYIYNIFTPVLTAKSIWLISARLFLRLDIWTLRKRSQSKYPASMNLTEIIGTICLHKHSKKIHINVAE